MTTGSSVQKLARVDATVQGEVQRVGYRYIVQDTARRLGVKGYVQNMPDGAIKIVAEAPEDVIQSFIEALKTKEPPITVENIQATYSEPTGEFQHFTIKYGDPTEEMAEGFGAGLRYVNLSRRETREGFQGLRTEMKEGFETLRSETKEGFGTLRTETREGFQTLGNEMKGMREDMNKNFREMSEKYDAILQSLGEAIKMIQEESTKTRSELIRAVDNLSRLVEEFLKSRRTARES